MFKQEALNTKTPSANFLIYYIEQIRVSIPGESCPSNHLSTFKLCNCQTVPPIAFVHDVEKNNGTLANREPQHDDYAIKHSLSFSQCYKYH